MYAILYFQVLFLSAVGWATFQKQQVRSLYMNKLSLTWKHTTVYLCSYCDLCLSMKIRVGDTYFCVYVDLFVGAIYVYVCGCVHSSYVYSRNNLLCHGWNSLIWQKHVFVKIFVVQISIWFAKWNDIKFTTCLNYKKILHDIPNVNCRVQNHTHDDVKGHTNNSDGRGVWRYQRGNQNPYIEEEHKTQWSKVKVQMDKQLSTKYVHKDRVRGSSSCSTSGTRRVNLVTNLVISLE
jgi:hypothetical protein